MTQGQPTHRQARDLWPGWDWKRSRVNPILTSGNLIQKTPRAEPIRKGTETARVPGGRIEATISQNHMQAKVMRKQKLWVNRKLTGSKRSRAELTPGAGEHLAVRWWSAVPRAAVALETYDSPSMYRHKTPLTPSSSSLKESGLCDPRNKIKKIGFPISASHLLAPRVWASQLTTLVQDCLDKIVFSTVH